MIPITGNLVWATREQVHRIAAFARRNMAAFEHIVGFAMGGADGRRGCDGAHGANGSHGHRYFLILFFFVLFCLSNLFPPVE
jgi:hypothetical protein